MTPPEVSLTSISDTPSRHPPTVRVRSRCVGSARPAQEAEERCRYRSRLIETPNLFSESPPQLAVFLFALMLRCMSPLLGHSGRARRRPPCPLSGVKQTRSLSVVVSGNDPKRTSASPNSRNVPHHVIWDYWPNAPRATGCSSRAHPI
jgi:hypothetical protein